MTPSQTSVADPVAPRVLVVDDEEIVLVALRETLRRAGYEVVAVSNPKEALVLLTEQSFSVILTDQQMPGMTGLEFLERVRQLQPHAVRILISAVLSLNTLIEAINKGEVFRFLIIPWMREDLLAAVKDALERYELMGRHAALRAELQAKEDLIQRLTARLASGRDPSAGPESPEPRA